MYKLSFEINCITFELIISTCNHHNRILVSMLICNTAIFVNLKVII